MDILTGLFLGGVLLLLIAASVGLTVLRRYIDYGVDPAILLTFRTRLKVWWILFGSLICVFLVGPLATTFLFFVLSIGVLREYITLTPKSPVDHQTLFWIYVFFTPLQFILVGINPAWFHYVTGLMPYQVFSVLLPGYVFLILPGFMATSGDPKRFLERTAKLQLGLIVCVYALSYVPALLTLDLPDTLVREEAITSPLLNQGLENAVMETFVHPIETNTTDWVTAALKDGSGQLERDTSEVPSPVSAVVRPRIVSAMCGKHFRLLFFFVIIVQFGDVFQYLWSQISLRHIVAPKINATRTWEGVFGGAITTALLGVALWYFTPFSKWWMPGLIALITSLVGFCGSMTMSAIKRDRGVSGYGSLLQGHSGLLDRIDSLCFAAPLFYHIAWLFSR